MFEFFKRKKPMVPLADASGVPVLFFKDGSAAIEYACKYMDCTLKEGSFLPAIVLDAKELFGAPSAVKTEENGNQVATLRVASDDGGFLVLASTAGPKGPKLLPGQLVAWDAMKYVPAVAQSVKDKRFGWVGLIFGTLKTEHRNGSWVGDKRFLL